MLSGGGPNRSPIGSAPSSYLPFPDAAMLAEIKSAKNCTPLFAILAGYWWANLDISAQEDPIGVAS